MIIHTTRSTALGYLLSLFFVLSCAEGSMVPDRADRQFLNRAMAASQAELEIARMAPRNAGKEEIHALAQRLITYHVRLIAALREFARLRKVGFDDPRDPNLDRLIKSFEERKGRAYDDAFRQLFATDPAGLLPLYRAGAADASDLLLRRLAERVYGELKVRRPASAKALFRQQIAGAQEQRKATAKTPKKAGTRTAAQGQKTKSTKKTPSSRRAKAPRAVTTSPSVKRGQATSAAAMRAEQKEKDRIRSGSSRSARPVGR